MTDPIASDKTFTHMVTHQALANPYAQELDALKGRAPGQLLSHEKIRLSRLTSFNQLFRQAAPVYHSAVVKGDWPTAAAIASKVAGAAKSLAAAVLLALLTAGAARAQQFPYQIPDPAISENFDYLESQITTINQDITAVEASVASISSAVANSGSTITVSLPLSGTGTAGNPVKLSGAIPAVNVDLSTPTTRFNAVALSTSALGLSTGTLAFNLGASTAAIALSTTALDTRLQAVGVSTAAIGLSTGTLAFNIGASTQAVAVTTTALQLSVGISTAALGQSTGTISVQLAAVGTSTAALGLSTGALNISTQSLQSQINGLAVTAGTQTVTFIQESFMHQITGTRTAFTLTYTPTSANSIFLVLDGLLLSGTSDYTYTAPRTVTLTTAPAPNTQSFFAQYALNTSTSVLSATSVIMSSISAPTYNTAQDFMNATLSPGRISGGAITNGGTNKVDVAAGTGLIKATDSDVATLSFFNFTSSAGSHVAVGTTRYLGIQYNSGSPNLVSKTADSWDLDTEFPLGVVSNEGGTIYISTIPWQAADNNANLIERFDSLAAVSRDNRVGGLTLSGVGTRQVSVTAGSLMARMSEFSTGTFSTASGATFNGYYQDGAGGWTVQVGSTQWNNSQYDNGTGTLASLTLLYFTSRWFYLMTDGSLAMLYGQNQYAALASVFDDAAPSSVPSRIQKMGVLIGRFIVQNGASSPSVTQSAFGTAFTQAQVTSHLDLTDIGSNTHAQIDTHIAATGSSAHSATNAATASQIATRDAAGGVAFAGVTATSVTATTTGNTVYGVTSSTGIKISAGCYTFSTGNILCDTPSGAGDVTKSGNNAMTGANTQAASEKMLLGSTFYLDVGAGFISSGTNISHSTCGYLQAAGFSVPTSGIFSVAIATLTFTADDYRWVISTTISCRGNGGQVGVSFLVDSLNGTGAQYPQGFNNTSAMVHMQPTAGGIPFNCSGGNFEYVHNSTGTFKINLTGTGTVAGTSIPDTDNTTLSHKSRWCVGQLK